MEPLISSMMQESLIEDLYPPMDYTIQNLLEFILILLSIPKFESSHLQGCSSSSKKQELALALALALAFQGGGG